jgi:hypothetical protein
MVWLPVSRIDTAPAVFAPALLALEAYDWYYYTHRCTPSSQFADSCLYTFPSPLFVVGVVGLLVLCFRFAVDSLAD